MTATTIERVLGEKIDALIDDLRVVTQDRDTHRDLCRKAIKERDVARSERDRVNACIRSECAAQVSRLSNELAQSRACEGRALVGAVATHALLAKTVRNCGALRAELAERTRERDLAQADRDALRYACERNGVSVACVSMDGREGMTRRVAAKAVEPLREWRDADGWRGTVTTCSRMGPRLGEISGHVRLHLRGPDDAPASSARIHDLTPPQARGIAAALNQCADLAESP